MKLCILAQVTSAHLGRSFLKFYPIYHFGYLCVLLQNIFILLWYLDSKDLKLEKKNPCTKYQSYFSFVQNCLMMSVRGAVSFFSSRPSPSPSHPSRLIQSTYLSVLRHKANSLLAVYFTYGNVSLHVTLFIHLTLSSPLPMSISLFSMSVFPLLPCK